MYATHQYFCTNVAFSRNRASHSRIRQLQRFEGVRFLSNSPTLTPRVSGLTSTIRFHENFSNSGKNCHPQNVAVDTRPPENSQRSYRGNFLKLSPLTLSIESLCRKKISLFRRFLRKLPSIFAEELFVTRSLRFETSSVFKGIAFFAFLLCSFAFEHPVS
jgi:hypothetical protein